VRSAPFSVLAIGLLSSCSLGPPPQIVPHRFAQCGDLRRNVQGSWVYETHAMELRPDGSLLRDAVEGAYRVVAPGHVTLDVAGSHEEHTYGMMTGTQLLDIDVNGRARTWTRVSLVPELPASCFEIHGSIVGDWTDGAESESFLPDGSWVHGDVRGNWSTPEAGLLDVAVGLSVRRYRVAIAAPDLMVSAIDGPVIDVGPRGAASIESRIR
jgi:hypothetical protein